MALRNSDLSDLLDAIRIREGVDLIREIPSSFGYWAAMLHLYLYSLAWVHPERGLEDANLIAY